MYFWQRQVVERRYLNNLNGFRITRPIGVRVEQWEAADHGRRWFTASTDVAIPHGYGFSPDAAVDDLADSIVEYYAELARLRQECGFSSDALDRLDELIVDGDLNE